MSDTRTEAERLRDAADSEYGGETLYVLVISTGLIPSPLVFKTAEAARLQAIRELTDANPQGFIYHTVEGSGGTEADAEALDKLRGAELARTLVGRYLMNGGCVFNDSGDEYRLFETTVELEAGT